MIVTMPLSLLRISALTENHIYEVVTEAVYYTVPGGGGQLLGLIVMQITGLRLEDDG